MFITFITGVFAGIIGTALYNKGSRILHLRRATNFPRFKLESSFTFSSSGDDRIFKIIDSSSTTVHSEIDFSYNGNSGYAGLVVLLSNTFLRPYAKKGSRVNFDIIPSNIDKMTLEFKANFDGYQNKVIGTYDIDTQKESHSVKLNTICADFDKWEDITEIVFLVHPYEVNGKGGLIINNMELIK